MSAFYNIRPVPPSNACERAQAYSADRCTNKVNLFLDSYRTEEGKPWVLPVVKKAEAILNQDETVNHEYILPCGLPQFRRAATVLLLGEDSRAITENRAFGVQTISGSGGLRLGAEFLARLLEKKVFYYSNPSFENYPTIFYSAGFILGKTYRYWDNQYHILDTRGSFNDTISTYLRLTELNLGLLEDLKNAFEGSVIILQPCGHNPTGWDPKEQDWENIANIIVARKLFPFFDFAYQGVSTGDIDQDAWPIRYFAKRNIEFFCAHSFSRMFGMYGDRIGNLCVVQKFVNTSDAVREEFAQLILRAYQCPPAFGARIITTILNDPNLRKEWLECVDTMYTRIAQMRSTLHRSLLKLGGSENWNSLIEQNGMYWYSGLTDLQIQMLAKEYHIYVASSGRVSLCGLNGKNIKCVASAISEVGTKYNPYKMEKLLDLV